MTKLNRRKGAGRITPSNCFCGRRSQRSREYKPPVAKHNQVICLIESPNVAPDHGFQEKSNKGIPYEG